MNIFKHLIESISEMHFNYLYLDEKSLSYSNLLEKILLSGEGNETSSYKSPEDFNGYGNVLNSDYYNVKKYFLIKKKIVEYIKILADYYNKLIVRDLREQLPKVTGQFLLKPIKGEIRFYLLQEIRKENNIVDLMQENPAVKEKREYYLNQMKLLKEAEKNLNMTDE